MPNTQYLTYDEYVMRGGKCGEVQFLPLEFKCRKRIDYLTMGRVKAMSEVPECVKMCMMLILGIEEGVGVQAQIQNPKAQSFSTDGYSESYGDTFSYSTVSRQIDNTIRSTLMYEVDDKGEHLMYQGVASS